MQDQFDTSTKVVIDLFNRQYDQFDNTIKRIAESNDKAHDSLFKKIEDLSAGQQDIKDTVHNISSTQQIMLHNYEAQVKEVSDMKDKLQVLSDRVDSIEEDYTKRKHVWQLSGKILAVAVTLSALIGFALKVFGIF